MKTIIFSAIIVITFLMGFSKKNTEQSCTCIFYNSLREQLEGQYLIASVKVIKIDTVRFVPSYWGNDKDVLRYIYDSNYKNPNIIFKVKRVFKGKPSADTFCVLSKNECSFQFEMNQEYIVASHYENFCQLELVSDSVKCNTQSLLCTDMCCGNTTYSESLEKYYIQSIK